MDDKISEKLCNSEILSSIAAIINHPIQLPFLPDKCHLNLPTLSLEALKPSQEREQKWENEIERCYDNRSHKTFKLDTT